VPRACIKRLISVGRFVLQMKLDFDSYNDNNEHGATLEPLDVNFQKDLDEMSLSGDIYDPDLEAREDEDEGDDRDD